MFDLISQERALITESTQELLSMIKTHHEACESAKKERFDEAVFRVLENDFVGVSFNSSRVVLSERFALKAVPETWESFNDFLITLQRKLHVPKNGRGLAAKLQTLILSFGVRAQSIQANMRGVIAEQAALEELAEERLLELERCRAQVEAQGGELERSREEIRAMKKNEQANKALIAQIQTQQVAYRDSEGTNVPLRMLVGMLEPVASDLLMAHTRAQSAENLAAQALDCLNQEAEKSRTEIHFLKSKLQAANDQNQKQQVLSIFTTLHAEIKNYQAGIEKQWFWYWREGASKLFVLVGFAEKLKKLEQGFNRGEIPLKTLRDEVLKLKDQLDTEKDSRIRRYVQSGTHFKESIKAMRNGLEALSKLEDLPMSALQERFVETRVLLESAKDAARETGVHLSAGQHKLSQVFCDARKYGGEAKDEPRVSAPLWEHQIDPQRTFDDQPHLRSI